MNKKRIPDWLMQLVAVLPLLIAVGCGFVGAVIGAFVLGFGIPGWVIGFGIGFVVGLGGASLS